MFKSLLATLLLTPISPTVTKPKGEIWVLIVDTGIAKHKDLTSVVYDNSVHYEDNNGHGTHIAGIVQSGEGGDKVCDQVKIFSCKYFDPKYSDPKGIAKCLRDAKRLNMDYVNVSGGGSDFIKEEYEAFRDYRGIVYAALGNNSEDLDKGGNYFPASYAYAKIKYSKGVTVPLRNINYVQAICGTEVCKYSNYKSGSIRENGNYVMSTFKNGGYNELRGTSQSTALALHKELKRRCSTLKGEKYGQ